MKKANYISIQRGSGLPAEVIMGIGIDLKTFFFISFFITCVCYFILSGAVSARTTDEENNIEVYKKTAQAVVNVSSVVVKYDYFYRPVPQQGIGSGVIIDEKGLILTNNHVIQNASVLEITLADGSKWPAALVGTDPDSDIAVIKADIQNKKLTVIQMGSSKDLEVGQKVLAIGNPFGLGQTLTTGVISSVGRSIRTNTGAVIHDVIQSDAAINPGNSGGPLLNSKGEMIGINTAVLSPTGANVGIGFGIPVDRVKKVVPKLIQGKFTYFGFRFLIFFVAIFLVIYLFRRFRAARKERP